MSAPYSIKIFLPAGEPNGLRILERPNWTGVGVAFGRTGFKEAATRPELKRTGVYILVGESSDESPLPMLYIGEGDPILDRLKMHNANKDFWTFGVAFTSKDTSLNKAHVQHLESRLIEIARKAKLCKLENSVNPTQPSLTEADCADTEQFLYNMLSILPLLGVSAFVEQTGSITTEENKLVVTGKGVTAQAVQKSTGFIVLKGSEVAATTVRSCPQHYVQKRIAMVELGLLIERSEKYVFTEDVSFPSPSYAASIVLGRSTNGLEAWKNMQGVSLKQIQAEDTSTE